MAYLLDTNIFIDAKNRYYAFDIVPSYWPKLLRAFQAGKVLTIDAVATEIEDDDDDFVAWFKANINRKNGLVWASKADITVVSCYQAVAQLVMDNQQYSDPFKGEFLSGADPWLISAAKAGNHIVATNEVMSGPTTKRVKIPDICQQMSVPYVDIFEMMRKTNIVV